MSLLILIGLLPLGLYFNLSGWFVTSQFWDFKAAIVSLYAAPQASFMPRPKKITTAGSQGTPPLSVAP